MVDSVYIPGHRLVKWMTILLVARAALGVIALWSDWLEIDLLERAAVEDITDEEADASDTRQGLIGLTQTGIYIALVVLFCLWIPAGGTPRWQQRRVSPILPLWWALWLISGFAKNAAHGGWSWEFDDEPLRATGATIFADAIDVPLAIVALLLVRSIHRMQESNPYTTVFD
jgi:hypothetical protein